MLLNCLPVLDREVVPDDPPEVQEVLQGLSGARPGPEVLGEPHQAGEEGRLQVFERS